MRRTLGLRITAAAIAVGAVLLFVSNVPPVGAAAAYAVALAAAVFGLWAGLVLGVAAGLRVWALVPAGWPPGSGDGGGE